jgi:hypothetical protein
MATRLLPGAHEHGHEWVVAGTLVRLCRVTGLGFWYSAAHADQNRYARSIYVGPLKML